MKYYNSDYLAISQSMLKDFMRSKEYYKKKYIDRELPDEDSEVFKVGLAVDCYVKHGKEMFLSDYSYKVLKKDNPDEYAAQKFDSYGKTLLSETNYGMVKMIGEYLRAIPDVVFLNQNCLTDVILRKENLVGELDYLYVDDNRAVIIDLKTAENIDKRPFFYKALEYGYFIQLAYYRMLVRHCYPNIKDIKCYILAAEKDKHFSRARFYEISATTMDKQDEIIKNALSELEECVVGNKPWTDPAPTFMGAQELQLINETYNDII